ncbi:urea carboxylase [Lampropedia puyangensis]|uniref:Urea carboxylase n=1 Tax=Lampropedia puyangensis TaxID=1330072 RepID=A0A4S8FCW8_9BURK|nr:urea carboxylase [Lampropedia puyangensis]THU04444.1 urea carboxylase [Lampropedia puyangensis]
MFHTVLIANRGEIAVRAIRTLKKLGIKSVAIYSDADRNAEHVRMADVAIALGGDKPSESYLRIDKVLAACQESGAQAVFPGYGFLSESTEFGKVCEDHGVVFIGPTSVQIEEFGLKHRARELAAAAGVPMTPGTGLLQSVDEALTQAQRIGYPVMLKTTAGGGGIGLTRCNSAEELTKAYESVQRLGEQFFRDGGVFLERFVDNARHVEVQIFGDGKGRVAALGERDCSVQRRNQKIIEETPAPLLPAATRKALLDAAVRLGESIHYRSAGTVEFVYDAARDAFYFLEVNTRLQVEHPVTEAVTGLDLVECMLQVAAGDPLDWDALSREPEGAAIEVRVYAEDPLKNFLPSPGTLMDVHFPEDVRVDGWVSTGTEVASFYDPMIAKIIVKGIDRADALARLQKALSETRIHGIATNLEYLRQIVAQPRFLQGDVSTQFLNTFVFAPPTIEVMAAGTATSVQDYPGREGYWDIGVPPSGPMDDLAFRIANRLVGNAPQAAALECTLSGPTLKFHADAIVAITGALTPATLDGDQFPMWSAVPVKAGQILKLGKVTTGCRTYVAVRNGLDVPVYLGSRSTFALGQFGGHAGRNVRNGDMLAISQPALPACTTPAPVAEPAKIDTQLVPTYPSHWNIGVMYGPHGAPDFLQPEAIEMFFGTDWQVHYNSNRLGIRLVGPKPTWARSDGGEAGLHPSNVHDCEYAIGSINFSGDTPIILAKDGPSLGGFVCPVTIVKAELWKVGQLKPGDTIRFHALSYEQALALQHRQEEAIASLKAPAEGIASLPVAASKALVSTIVAQVPANGHQPLITYRQAGDSYLLLEYGENELDIASRLHIHLLMQHVKAHPIAGVAELSPGVRSLQVHYDSLVISQTELVEKLLEIEQQLPDVSTVKVPTRVVHLPVAWEDSSTLGAVQRYQETVKPQAPWLPNNVDFIQRINGLDHRDEVRDIFFQTSYLVMGLGDVYLGAPCAVPLDPRHRLLTSKYNPARTYTAEGAVGIGGVYMCIYGMDSPGGYQLVGRTVPIWNKFLKNPVFHQGQPWLLRFFDQVRFYPVSEAELNQFRDDFREGRATVCIEQEVFDYAAYQQFLQDNADSISTFKDKQAQAFKAEVALWKDEVVATQEPVAPELPSIAVQEGQLLVEADLSGSIWKILVEPGQSVGEGETLVIVEAMKMEVHITAPAAAKVDRIACQTGRAVNSGDALLVLTPH